MLSVEDLISEMTFYKFNNKKKYSFDYQHAKRFKKLSTRLEDDISKELISSANGVFNIMPIFIPTNVKRISFFEYSAKSVRSLSPENVIKRLKKKSSEVADADIKTFKEYHKLHNCKEYSMDVLSKSVQFNAYDKDDNLIIEKSFTKGGLVFNSSVETLEKDIIITYPRHRKKRTDIRNNYLPLKSIEKLRPKEAYPSST